MLCYIQDRQLRILDLHRSRATEIVVDVRGLLRDGAIDDECALGKYKFQPLYFANDVVSCLFTRRKPNQAHWLVVFNVRQGRILTTHRLISPFKLFVRNSDSFLCYGVYLPTSREGPRRWAVGGYDIKSDTWVKHKLDLPELIGCDIGSTISFDVFDGYLYGVSNQTSLEAEELDWMSYYTCFRFPLTRDGFRTIEHASREHMWRRWHFEGPIDDRWSFLRIFKDESTSQLKVIESRKEWLGGSSSAKRTYYTTKIVFDDGGEAHSPSANASLPEAARLAALSKTSQPDFATTPLRDPYTVHPGDDGSEALMFTLTKSPVRCYHLSCQTFVDLVDDPPPFDSGTQRLRIRGGTRRRWTPGERDGRSAAAAAASPLAKQEPKNTFEKLADMYKHGEVVLWPPEQDSAEPDPALASLYNVLNPPGHFGHIRGSWDERSMVYSVDGKDGCQALVFLSFDPAISLKGVKRYPGTPIASKHFGTPSEGSARPHKLDMLQVAQPCEDGCKGLEPGIPISEANTTDWPGGGTAPSEPVASVGPAEWQTHRQAMYQTISAGYHFCL